jgi:predicted translin family RNA/ssDNA-binding protein
MNQILYLKNAKRTLQEIYEICQQCMSTQVDKTILSAFQNISNKADYARSQIEKALKDF